MLSTQCYHAVHIYNITMWPSSILSIVRRLISLAVITARTRSLRVYTGQEEHRTCVPGSRFLTFLLHLKQITFEQRQAMVPTITCSECQEDFSSRNKLFSHIRVVHQGEDPPAAPAPAPAHTSTDTSSSGKVTRSRPGRVARRRNKEERQRKSKSATESPRLESLDGFPRRRRDGAKALTLQDAQAVTDQLGFAPTNLIEVSTFSSSALPPVHHATLCRWAPAVLPPGCPRRLCCTA